MEVAAIAAQDAEAVRGRSRAGQSIDPVVAARRLGAQVLLAPLDSAVASALVKEPGQAPVILLNERDSVGRQRFNCARCLGRLYQWLELGGQDEFFHLDHRRGLLGGEKELGDEYADHFACAFLLPAVELLRLKGRHDLNAIVAFKMGTTPESVAFRLQEIERALA